jgi:hypothetical protein
MERIAPWAIPSKIFEGLVFDGRRGNRLRFVDWFPSRCKDFARTVMGGAGMRFAKLGQTKPPTGLGMRRPGDPGKKELCY